MVVRTKDDQVIGVISAARCPLNNMMHFDPNVETTDSTSGSIVSKRNMLGRDLIMPIFEVWVSVADEMFPAPSHFTGFVTELSVGLTSLSHKCFAASHAVFFERWLSGSAGKRLGSGCLSSALFTAKAVSAPICFVLAAFKACSAVLAYEIDVLDLVIVAAIAPQKRVIATHRAEFPSGVANVLKRVAAVLTYSLHDDSYSRAFLEV